MSLYNMIHGTNPLAPHLLRALGTVPSAIPRFRDCFLSKGPDEDGMFICIHTRTGGGNRAQYEKNGRSAEDEADYADQPANDDLRLLPGFVSDSDDDFDCTYANFYYAVPEALKAECEAEETPLPPGERWAAVFKALAR